MLAYLGRSVFSIHDGAFSLPGGREAPAFLAAAADLLAGRPAVVFRQVRDALSHDVRECRRGLTLTAWWALEVLHLPRGALLLQSMFSASNPSRLAPANASATHIIIHSDANEVRLVHRRDAHGSELLASEMELTPGIFPVRQRSELSSPSFRGVLVEPAFEVQSRESNPVRCALYTRLHPPCCRLT